jgi:hypothetical protein
LVRAPLQKGKAKGGAAEEDANTDVAIGNGKQIFAFGYVFFAIWTVPKIENKLLNFAQSQC